MILLCVLYSDPAQNGETPPESIMYRITPADHMSEQGAACEQRITSGLMNSSVPHIVIGMRSAYKPGIKEVF